MVSDQMEDVYRNIQKRFGEGQSVARQLSNNIAK